MFDSLVELQWYYKPSGYKWTEISNGSNNELHITCDPDWYLSPSVSESLELYNPMKYTSLFRTFSDLQITKEAILAFANKYGVLGTTLDRWGKPTAYDSYSTEPFTLWDYEIRAMKEAVLVWDKIRDNNFEWFHHCVRAYDDNTRWFYTPTLLSKVPCSDRFSLPWSDGTFEFRCPRVPPGVKDIEMIVGRAIITYLINVHADKSVQPKLIMDDEHKLQFRIVAPNLVAALWLQLAQAVTTNKDFRCCKQCGTWYELTPETSRTNKVHCSNACRSKAYRQRQEKARALYSSGKSVEDIAKKLDTDVDTAAGWITSTRRRKQ